MRPVCREAEDTPRCRSRLCNVSGRKLALNSVYSNTEKLGVRRKAKSNSLSVQRERDGHAELHSSRDRLLFFFLTRRFPSYDYHRYRFSSPSSHRRRRCHRSTSNGSPKIEEFDVHTCVVRLRMLNFEIPLSIFTLTRDSGLRYRPFSR